MRIYFIAIIAVLTADASSEASDNRELCKYIVETDYSLQQSCEELRQLESTCGRYCFKVVKPILEHTRALQKQVDLNETRQKSESINKLENIERLLHEKFDRLEKQTKQNLEDANNARKCDDMGLFDKIGDKYYYIDTVTRLNWFEAAHRCHELGGHLANLQTRAEFDAVEMHLISTSYWLDINDLGEEGEFYSLATGRKATFFKWYPGEPNNVGDNEDCVQIRKVDEVYALNDVDCNIKFNYICEKQR
ncbi:C-type lectin 37Da-like [Drosophila novamexicana]|uniref:C-type lectin 37Da-like n=1 Tax=Drosophila novamexicana TaxID=47314 RepID=UPI0011E5BA84|nr:C-type lectin 37Da-like [Drosophila novamexicana]